jgi:hypothetical protein
LNALPLVVFSIVASNNALVLNPDKRPTVSVSRKNNTAFEREKFLPIAARIPEVSQEIPGKTSFVLDHSG